MSDFPIVSELGDLQGSLMASGTGGPGIVGAVGGSAGTGTTRCWGRLSWVACPSAGMTAACCAARPCTGWSNRGCSAWRGECHWGSLHPWPFLPGGDDGDDDERFEGEHIGPQLCSAVFSLPLLPPAPLFPLKHQTWLLPYPLRHRAAPRPSCLPPPAPPNPP